MASLMVKLSTSHLRTAVKNLLLPPDPDPSPAIFVYSFSFFLSLFFFFFFYYFSSFLSPYLLPLVLLVVVVSFLCLFLFNSDTSSRLDHQPMAMSLLVIPRINQL